MRSLLTSLLALSAVTLSAVAQTPTCTGLCLQQVSCPAGTATTVTGKIYAPNGNDPLPDITVFVPNAPVDPFTPGVSCPVVGQAPSGSPLVGITTSFDGSFQLTNVPVGTNIPLVIQTGRWRRQVVIPAVTACVDTAFSTRMPKNQAEGDIPKFAIATGSADQVECVLHKVGIDYSEFTDISGTGRINLFSGTGSPGAMYPGSTANETDLMGTAATLNGYDVLMLPCQGGAYGKSAQELQNIVDFANAGGRIYSSHFSYVWMNDNQYVAQSGDGPFSSVAKWDVNQKALADGPATVDQTFSQGVTLAQWLQVVGASTTPGQISVSTTKHDQDGVNAPTQSWLTLNDTAHGNPVMQFVFDAPVGRTGGQCGRVLFNEYHVEAPTTNTSAKNAPFPTECVDGALTPQEKLLEYSLFELTADGNAATLTPTTADFGTQAIGFNTAPQTFTWTNNSTFAATVTLLKGSSDFVISSSNCGVVAPGKSCLINVVFNPTASGARTGTLTVGSSGTTLTSALTGKGIPDLYFSVNSLTFGSIDVGAVQTQNLTVTNSASGSVAVPPFVVTGDFFVSSTCGSSLSAGASCTLSVSFKPSATGSRPGTMALNSTSAAYSSVPTILNGNGVDFTFALSPTTGDVIAGYKSSTMTTTTPLAGFLSPLRITCTTTAPATTCVPDTTNITPTNVTQVGVSITTGAKFTIVGYGGTGGGGILWVLALGSGVVLLCVRRRHGLVRAGLVMLVLAAGALSSTGCSGKLPAQNASYTPAGTYTFTVTATDGFLVHSATYGLTVRATN